MAAEFKTLIELYENSIKKFGSNNLFGVKKNGVYTWNTYRQFGQEVDSLRAGLAGLGIEPKDTVAIIADNRPEWAACAYATYGRNASYCPMYESQLPKDWEYILDDSGTKVLFVANQEIYDQTVGFIDSISTLEHVIFFDGDASHKHSYQSLLAKGKTSTVENIQPTPDDLAGFIYTSGTTGKPKGVLLNHSNICFNVNGILNVGIIRPDDTSLAFLPWAHSFGQNCELHAMFGLGAAMGLIENVTTIIQNLSEVKPTLLFAVPRIFNRIYDGLNKRMEDEPAIKQKLFAAGMANSDKLRREQEANRPGMGTMIADKLFDKVVFSKVRERFGGRLRMAVSGGSALSPEVARFIDNLHIEVYEGYGLTETSPLISVNLPGARKIGSVGRPITGVEVDIRDVEGYPKGTGEICVRGDLVMQGYHALPDKTAEVLDADRTFHTGDLGRVDEDGFLWILGRVKEQYKLENGKYVVPSPIEEQLALSPFILQCMIEGANKPYNVALIVVDTEALNKWAKEQNVSGDLLNNPRVQELIKGELERVGEGLKGYEKPKKFKLLDEEWTTANGILTPKMSLKRRVVMERYGHFIEEMLNA